MRAITLLTLQTKRHSVATMHRPGPVATKAVVEPLPKKDISRRREISHHRRIRNAFVDDDGLPGRHFSRARIAWLAPLMHEM